MENRMTKKPTDISPNMIRMRESLRVKIEAAAKSANRSMNAEMVARLDASFERLSAKDEMKQALREVLNEREATPQTGYWTPLTVKSNDGYALDQRTPTYAAAAAASDLVSDDYGRFLRGLDYIHNAH